METINKRFMYYAGILAAAGANADDLKHISDLLDLEEQGRLIKLPCKVGDKFYLVEDGYIYDFKADEIMIRKENGKYIFRMAYMDFKEGDFGKTVFLTKAEAEKALEEMEE